MTAGLLRGRRIVMVPVVVLVELLVIATAPLTLAIAAVVGALTRSSRPVRSVAVVVAYAVIELWTLQRLRDDSVDGDELARDVLDRGYRALERILDVQVVLEDGSASTDRLQQSRGLIVLSRHCGPGDSLFVAWLLAVHHRLALRVVLKSALRWEPVVDAGAHVLPLCFVSSGGDGAREGVRTTASALRPGEALLLFPEGGNFSWQRWREAIAHLTRRGEHRWARRARRRTHTLPPRPGGAVAALAAAPQADVLLIAHSGLAKDGRDRPWWRLPVHQQLVVRTMLVPADEVPRDDEPAREFLDEAWSRVDTWVESHAALRTG